MAGPTTEVLNDDLKGLREDLHKVQTEIMNDVHKVAIEVAKLSAVFNFAKWLIGLTLSACISGIVFGIWWAATLSANVKILESNTTDRLTKLEESVGKSNDRLAKLEESVGKSNDRLAKLEESVGKIVEYTKPKAKAD